MKRLLKEPLLHFLLLGAVIFIAYGWVSLPSSGAAGTVVVTAGRIEHLAAGFEKTWQRRPTDVELQSLTDDWVREEIATREALALGLDKDDTVIRRRLRQKLEFVSEDAVAQTEPTDAELGAYLQAHAGSFDTGPRFTFSQVYLNPDRHRDRLARDTTRLLEQLQQRGEADSVALGDSTLLDHRFTDVSSREIATQFGEQFAATLATLPPRQWQGPLQSGYGVHVVRVERRTEGHPPELADVREAVRREWANTRRVEGTARFYQELLKRYTVRIESLEPVAEQKRVAEAK